MKKLLPLLSLACSLVCAAALAGPCPRCGTELPVAARFCLDCGMEQVVTPVKKPGVDPKTALFRNFAPVDEFARTAVTGIYSSIVGGFPQFKITSGNSLAAFKRVEGRLPEELRIAGRIYGQKIKALYEVVGVTEKYQLDYGIKDALMAYYSFVLAQYDEIIQSIRASGPFSATDLQTLRRQEQKVGNRLRRYEVTAKYLQVGREAIGKDLPFAVLEVKDNRAKVLFLGQSPSDTVVQGWVSLRSLETRTTWTSICEGYYRK